MALQRIVKMTFEESRCSDFEAYFETIKEQVGNQPGCSGVKLLKDVSGSGIYFTYSVWKNEVALNTYRNTTLFGEVWPKVKKWFSGKPEAWSTEIAFESEHKRND